MRRGAYPTTDCGHPAAGGITAIRIEQVERNDRSHACCLDVRSDGYLRVAAANPLQMRDGNW
jgi:hypothetical protein